MYKNCIIRLLLSLLCLIQIGDLAAADAQQVFNEANQAYKEGNYRIAADGYESILKGGNVFSKELFFNLGNAYFRLNEIGLSMLNYERALRLDPTDVDIQQNLGLNENSIITAAFVEGQLVISEVSAKESLHDNDK